MRARARARNQMDTDKPCADELSTSEKNIDPKQEFVTISDDEDEAKSKKENKVRFPNGISIGVNELRRYLLPDSRMTGVLASLVFNHFLPEYKGLRDKRINFCDPEALTNILAACEKTPVTTLTRETVAWFANRKGETPTYLKALLHSKLSMIPVCYSGHWVLGMLQLKRREEDIRARMIVVDSLFHSTSFKNLTQLVAEMAYSTFGVALKAALYLTNSKYDLGKYTLVRMEQMPAQNNTYDCGFYMAVFAEMFTKRTDWRVMSDAELRTLKLSPEEESELRNSVRDIRAEIAAYSVRVAGRPLRLVD